MKTAPDPKVCGAATRTGAPCQRSPVPGRTRCKLHGGATPRGTASPNYKNGRWSHLLPEPLAELYREEQTDEELTELGSDLRLVDARISQLLQELEATGGADWQAAIRAMRRLREKMAGGEQDDILAALEYLGELLEEGHGEQRTWSQIERLMAQRQRLSEAERKRKIEMGAFIPVEKAMVLATQLQAAVKAHVHDPDVIAAIGREFARITGYDPDALHRPELPPATA
jgi:hypothetical protein